MIQLRMRNRLRPAIGSMLVGMLLMAAHVSAAAARELPLSVNLRPQYEKYDLAIENQKGPLCWAYSVAGVLELALSEAQGRQVRLSPFYLNWAAQETDVPNGAGSNFGRALRGLQQYGICCAPLVGPADKEGEIPAPSEDAKADGRTRTAPDPRWIKLHDVRTGLTPEQFRAMKEDLADGHPVALGCRWPNEVRFDPPAHMVTPPPDKVYDGHCVILVGYDDAAEAFLIRNSHGAGFGDKGYAWLRYDFVNAYTNDALGFRLREPAPAGPGLCFEAEVLQVASAEGVVASLQEMGSFSPFRWSGDKQLFCQAAGPGGAVTLRLPDVPAGDYCLALTITRAPDYGQFQVALDGKPVGGVLDGCSPGVSPSGRLALGRVRLAASAHDLSLRITGKCPAASGYYAGVDTVELLGVK